MDKIAYTADEAGEALGVDAKTIRRLVDAGHLRRVPHMGRVLIARIELERFATSNLTEVES